VSSTVSRTCTFLTNHTRVLLAVEGNPTIRISDLARLIQVTERGVQGLIADLESHGCLTKVLIGRRNRYYVRYDTMLADPRDSHLTLGDLLRMTPAATERSVAVS
jgi:predicted transcriptional regulator of viral defense system